MAQQAQAPAMPLSMARTGDTLRVSRVRGNEDMRHHLANIGFVEGAEVHVAASAGSNLIVMVKGARFGIDAKVAQRIMMV